MRRARPVRGRLQEGAMTPYNCARWSRVQLRQESVKRDARTGAPTLKACHDGIEGPPAARR
eukprot:3959454-Pyramimonas_sp.AAC.1